ncbi:serine protease notopleural [Dermacentor variabilis]|uniref:serine protease notopleural n=1 Tax=Dermacentor variabilis TaxID=34621 RepID=UPI003F5CA9DA
MRSGLATLLAVASLHTWSAALALRVLDHRLFGATRTIKLKPCQNRVTSQEGTCMFAWDCFSAGGTHLTYCTDSFYTGSCCKLPPGVVVQQHDMPSEPANSIDSVPYEGDDDYKKRTKRPPTSSPKTTLHMSSKTTQPVTYAVTTPSHTPLPTTTGATPFVGLSTFTPGLITWRPHETTLPFLPDEPPSTVPNDYGSSASVPDTTTFPTTTAKKQTTRAPVTTTRAPVTTTRASVTTTRIPIVASTFLTPEETTAAQTSESAPQTTTKVTTEQPVETSSKPTETVAYGTTSQDYTKSTEAPTTSTQTPADDTTTVQGTTQRPSTTSVQSHTWIVNERETTMAIPQSVPTEQTWVVVDEADASGQQTTLPTQSETASQTTSTSSMADWSTVTDMVTSISWVDMTELSTTQKPPPEVPDTTPLQSEPPPPRKPVPPTASTTVSMTLSTATGADIAETDFVTVSPDSSEAPSLELVSATATATSTKEEVSTQAQTTTQRLTSTARPTTSQPTTPTPEVATTTTTRPSPILTTLALTTRRTTTTTAQEMTVPTTTTARTTWKYTTVPTYTVSEERETTTQAPTTKRATTPPTTVQSTLPKATTTTTAATTTVTTGPTTISPDKDIRKICGRPRTVPSARIVGGEQTKFAQWPWMISLRQFKRNNFLHKCGAALLNEYWAISAAHCVHNVSPTDILLRLGEYDLKSEREPLSHVERRVQIVATHPRFDASTFEYDLALLRLYEPVPFQDNVMPVCVPDTNDSFVGRSAVVTGWGRLYEDGPLPNVMQKVSVPIITNKECEIMYRKAGFIEDIPNIFICAGLAKGGKDSCEGDSGGPLVLKDPTTGQWSLIGIISWGIGCALPNQPGVYTRITHFADWIRQIIVF